MRRVGIVLLILALPGPFRAAADETASAPLRFLGNDRLPPYVWAEDGRPLGLTVDLARALAERASLDARIEAIDWTRAQALVRSGAADALLQINPSPEREQLYDFSGPLVESHFHLFRLTRRPEIRGLASLAGKRVGVEAGGLPLQYLERDPRVEPVIVPSWPKGFEMLADGRVDAVFLDRWVGEYELNLSRIQGIAVVEPAALSSASRIAVAKGNRSLLTRIDAGLQAIAADGTRDRILREWRGKEIVYISRESMDRLILGGAGGAVLVLTAIALMALGHAVKLRKANRLLAERERALVPLQALRASELRYRTLVDASGAVTWCCPPSGLHVEPQPAWMAFTGQSAEEMLGAGWTRAVHPDDLAAATERWSQAVARGEPFASEHRIRRHDGEWRWMSAHAAPIYDANGAVVEWIGMNLDIHERKSSDERRRADAERLTAVLEAQRDIAALRSDGTDFLHAVLKRLSQLVGAEGACLETVEGEELVYEAAWGMAEGFAGLRLKIAGSFSGRCLTERAIGRCDDSECDPYADRAACRRIGLRSMLTIPLRYDEDLFGVLKLMSTRVGAFDSAAERTLDLMRELLGATVARKRGEAALRELNERYELVLAGSGASIWDWDIPARKVLYSPQWKAMRGFAEEEIGDSEEEWSRGIHPEDAPRVMAAVQAHLSGETPYFAEEYRVRRKDGSWIWIADRGVARRGADGRVVRMAGSEIDIEERKRAEEALREAARRKDEFLATLGHELRNPLAPIRNACAILKLTGTPDPTAQSARDMIDRQVTHLVRLVDDLLDLSRVTRGKLELRKEPIALSGVLERAVELARPMADLAGHRLEVLLPPADIWLDADPVRLAQVFANLLVNACKYTPNGGHIALRVGLDGTEVVVTVADTGIGIAPEELSRVFEMFHQVSGDAEGVQSGLGIGLALARGLVEMHGGRVTAASGGPGQGSSFAVQLPVRSASSLAPSGVPEEPKAPEPTVGLAVRVLVADDREDALESLALLLRLHGAEVETARDGREAVAAAERFRPELVLLDLGMPELDGFGACRGLRAQPWGKEIKIVATSGWGQEGDRRKSEEAGFDAHLVKPVPHTTLLALLESVRSSGTRKEPWAPDQQGSR